jgi:hypothetical protein
MANRMIREIKRLLVLNGNGQLGDYWLGEVKEGKLITKIEDISDCYPDHTDFIYDVWSNDHLVAQVINCPVTIEFK